MRLFRRRRRPEPSGSLRLSAPSDVDAEYAVFTTSEHRFPDTYAAQWEAASDVERERRRAQRWVTLVPVHDPAFGVADLRAELDGMPAAYLRPPHLDRLARRIAEANVEVLEVPGLVEWGPAGPTLRLRVEDDAA